MMIYVLEDTTACKMIYVMVDANDALYGKTHIQRSGILEILMQ